MFFRAHYAVKTPLTTSTGMPTSALYGFFQMTIKLLKEVNPEFIAYLFDRKEPSFRKELYSQYKANRKEMPKELEKQVPYLRKITDVLGISSFDKLGYEADDLIGCLSKKANAKLKVVIVSGDKDFAQLIGPNVVMWDTMRDITYDVDRVLKKWNVSPGQFIDYLAICGDSSDNIPGVFGIGSKGATKLLDEFKTLEEIYKNLDSIKNEKLKQKLISSKHQAFLSKKLVTIKSNIEDFDISIEELKQKEVNKEKAIEILKELEFKFFEKTLFGVQEAVESLKVEIPEFKKEDLAKRDEVWGFIHLGDLILAKNENLYRVSLDNKDIINHLENLNLKWYGFDLKSLFREFKFEKSQTVAWCSQLACYLLQSKEVGSFNDVYETYLNKELPAKISPDRLYKAHLELFNILKKKLLDENVKKIYEDIELPLNSVLFDMEKNGLLLNVDFLKKLSQNFYTQLEELTTKIYKIAGFEFNILSPKQLSKVLFEDLKLRIVKKKKTGPSTDSSVLEQLINDHPIINLIIEYREISKLKSTYVDVLPTLIDKSSSRVHTHFRQASVATGRVASVNPNLQNIPIKTKRGREIRKAFIAPPGHKILSADYSQIELRLLAYISDDEGLKNAFLNDLDIHSMTASELFEVDLKNVTADQRRIAKNVNFGLAYGQSAFGLSKVLTITKPEAQEIIDNYFLKFPKVTKYMEDIVVKAKKNGFVETIFGRKRFLPDINSNNSIKRKMSERAAINAPLQGSASDLVKMAMIKISKFQNLKMLLQVHDELVFEISDKSINESAEIVKDSMENIADIKIPLKVDISYNQNWVKQS